MRIPIGKPVASLIRVHLPGGYPECVEFVRDYMGRTGLSAPELAERAGVGHSTVNMFVQGRYEKVASEWRFMAARLVEFIQRHPVEVLPSLKGDLFETENFRRISRYFTAATENGEAALLYGPPGTQKSFVLNHLIAARNRSGQNDAMYVYASWDMKPLPLLRAIGRSAGVMIGWNQRDRVKDNIIFNFKKRGQVAVVIDEAQHLNIPALEILRELHDQSGCGLVLAGSHNLYNYFLQNRANLAQWLQRIDHKEPLPGLLEDEVRAIAARELGSSNGNGSHPAKLSEKQISVLLDSCREDDIFARDDFGKITPRKYLSVRRLVKVLNQHKAAAKVKRGDA